MGRNTTACTRKSLSMSLEVLCRTSTPQLCANALHDRIVPSRSSSAPRQYFFCNRPELRLSAVVLCFAPQRCNLELSLAALQYPYTLCVSSGMNIENIRSGRCPATVAALLLLGRQHVPPREDCVSSRMCPCCASSLCSGDTFVYSSLVQQSSSCNSTRPSCSFLLSFRFCRFADARSVLPSGFARSARRTFVQQNYGLCMKAFQQAIGCIPRSMRTNQLRILLFRRITVDNASDS